MQQDEKGFLNVLEMFHWVLTPVVTSGFLLTTRFLSFLFTYLFIYLLAALGLRCCARAFSSCSEWGLLLVAVCGLLIAVASLIVEDGL